MYSPRSKNTLTGCLVAVVASDKGERRHDAGYRVGPAHQELKHGDPRFWSYSIVFEIRTSIRNWNGIVTLPFVTSDR
jgi:hypothetical protein